MAAPSNTPTKPFFAPAAVAYISEVIADPTLVDTTSTLKTKVEAATAVLGLTTVAKNVSVVPGTRDVDKIDVFGYPGQIKDKKKPAMTVATLTLVHSALLDTAQNAMEFLNGAGTSNTISTVSYLRTRGGDKASADRTDKAFYFENTASDGSIEGILMNNASVTDIERSLDADGHEELKLTIKCLAHDTWTESKAAS